MQKSIRDYIAQLSNVEDFMVCFIRNGILWCSGHGSCTLMLIHGSRIKTHYPTRTMKVEQLNRKEDTLNWKQINVSDGDLLIFGTASFWRNVTFQQALAFTRPLPFLTRMDTQLAIANATCLATWTTDDVQYIAYYLAHLAHNFSMAATMGPSYLDGGGTYEGDMPEDEENDRITLIVGEAYAPLSSIAEQFAK